MGRIGCCKSGYTTRAYKLNGDTLWSGNYFDGIAYQTVIDNGWKVTCQLIDANCVYVGGQRCTDGTNFWSLTALDIDTGGVLWKRDLYNDVLGTTADVVDTFNSGSGTYRALYNGTLQIELWGQGGSPANGVGAQVDGAQSGGYCKKTISITAGQSVSYVIGSNGHNQNGGNTTATFSPNTYTANGGSRTPTGAGTATNGDINTTGGAGSAGAGGAGGNGGNAPNGGTGGSGGASGFTGSDGNAPGGGGGGAGTGGGLSGLGGAGRVKFTLTPTDPIGYLGDVLQLQVNSSGNVVAMLDPSNTTYNRMQYFVEIQPNGTLANVLSFKQQMDPTLTTTNLPTLGFTINSTDVFHVLTRLNGVGTNGVFQCLGMYEFPSPYSTATVYEDRTTWGTTSHRSFTPGQIARYGDRDIIGGNSYNGLLSAGGAYDCPGLLRGASQSNSIRTWANISNTIYPFPSLSGASVAAAGSTQGTATALTAGNSTSVTSTVSNQGVILPSGASAGDCCSVRLSSGSNLRIYPPSGGQIIESDQYNRDTLNSVVHVENSTNTFVLLASSLGGFDDYFFCLGSNVWVRLAIRYQATSNYNQLVRWCPTIDSGDNIIAVNHKGELVKHTSGGLPTWWAGQTHIHSVCDGSDNIYAVGVRALTGASVVKRNSSGVYQWGHRHIGETETDLLNARKAPSLIHFDAGGDSSSGAIIASGQVSKTSLDTSFVSNPW